MAKGSNFEREICKLLSSWWTRGERDDVFWRSSMSGGRATVRFRKGKKTAGSYGDICALDPIGEPFLRIFTPELKRGQYVKHPGDLLDCAGSCNNHPFLKALKQAKTAHEMAGSRAWLLIVKRDMKHSSVFFPSFLLGRGEVLFKFKGKIIRDPIFRYRVGGEDFVGMRLEKFLKIVEPEWLTLSASPQTGVGKG
jgi:hypothetical protein